MPTITDIARETGLSIASVSNALNGKGRVSAKNRRLVIDTALRMGYDMGRVRGAERRRSVCVMLEHIASTFCYRIAQGISHAADPGYAVTFADLNVLDGGGPPDPDAGSMRRLLEQRVAQLDPSTVGVIYVSQYPRDLTGIMPKLSIPVVYAYGYAKGAPCVNTDDQQGAYDAVAHLIGEGRRRIAMISGPIDSMPMTKRFSGYQRALIDARIPVDLSLVRLGDWDVGRSSARMDELLALKERPDGIFCQSDHIAVGVMRAIRAAGLRVPGDIAVVGFDDNEFAALLDPPLTTVRQPLAQIGEKAFALLKGILEDREQDETDVLLKAELIRRASS
ncbi:MAG: LacI family transcriptional regulator [Clostridiales bacterium]|nr:LacI family transcriptional regulator [Clostridiales bacterium]